MVYYDTEAVLIQSCADMSAKITTIDAIITALYGQMLTLASQGSPIQEYMLNDGQTIIKTIYRTTTQIEATIDILTKQRNRYQNQINGRYIRAVDSKNFTGNGYCQ